MVAIGGKDILNFTARKRLWIAMTLAILSILLVLAREWSYGIALGWDSINYISVARSLWDRGEFASFYGNKSYYMYAFLYPILLSLGSVFAIDPHHMAIPINTVCWGLTVFISVRYMQKNVKSDLSATYVGLAIALSPSLTSLAAAALAGAPFILFLLLSLIKFEKFISTNMMRQLLYSAIFASLAFSLRYHGIALIAFIFMFLVARPDEYFWNKLRCTLVFGSISSLPMLLWEMRKFLLFEKSSALRFSFDGEHILHIAGNIWKILCHWIFPNLGTRALSAIPDVHYIQSVLMGLLFCALAAMLLMGIISRRVYKIDNSNSSSLRRIHLVFGGFLCAHFLFTIFVVASTHLKAEPRYFSPAFIPFLFAIVSFFLQYKFARKACKLTIILWFSYLGILQVLTIIEHNAKSSLHYAHQFLGYASPYWSEKEIFQYIRDESISGDRVYTPATGPVYLYTNVWKEYYGLPSDPQDLFHEIEKSKEKEEIYVVWIKGWANYSLDDLLSTDRLEVVADFPYSILLKKVKRSIVER